MLTLIVIIIVGGMALAIWKWIYTVSVWDDAEVIDDLEDAVDYAVEEAEVVGNAAASIVVDAVQHYAYGSQSVEVDDEPEDLVDDASEITQDDDSDVSDDE